MDISGILITLIVAIVLLFFSRRFLDTPTVGYLLVVSGIGLIAVFISLLLFFPNPTTESSVPALQTSLPIPDQVLHLALILGLILLMFGSLWLTYSYYRLWKERYSSILTHSFDGFFVLQDHRIQEVNSRLLELTGYGENELIGQPIWTIFQESDTDNEQSPLSNWLDTSAEFAQFELPIYHRSSKAIEVIAQFYRLPYNGKPAVQASIKDISHRKAAEQALKESEERFRSMFENAPIGIYRTTPGGEILMANNAFIRMLGYTSFEEISELNLEDTNAYFVQDYPREKYRARLEEEGEIKGLESTWVRPDNSSIIARESARIVRDDNGEILYYEGTVEDITKRKLAERELLKHYNQTRELYNVIQSLHKNKNIETIYSTAVKGVCSTLNIDHVAFVQFLHKSHLELTAEHHISSDLKKALENYAPWGIHELHVEPTIHPDITLSNLPKDITTAMKAENLNGCAFLPVTGELSLHGYLVLFFEQFHYFDSEAINTTTIIAQNLASAISRYRHRENLAAERNQLAVTLRSIGDGVITTDTEGRIVLINTVAEHITGWSQEEAQGHPLNEVFTILDETTREPSPSPVDDVLETEQIVEISTNTVLVTQNGRERLIADSAAPIHNNEGDLIGVVLVFRDITDQRELEQELLKIEKLESVERLASGLSNDYNNILAAILGNITMAKTHRDDPDKILHNLEAAEQSLNRAKHLTNQLLLFTEEGNPILEETELASLVNDVVDSMKNYTPNPIQINIAENLSTCNIDDEQIKQVLYNIISNSVEASPGSEPITITAKNCWLNAKHQLSTLTPGSYVKIDVADKGAGIAKEQSPKIFDPFFTTKKDGRGLGLTLAYSILKNHQGHITVNSDGSTGTTATIYLPAITPESAQKSTVETRVSAGSQRLLVMDDEKAIRDIIGEFLKEQKYSVEFATNGQEAVHLYEEAMQSEQPFDLVILDLTVPSGEGGKETMKNLMKIDPQVKAIVCSGYVSDPVMANYHSYGFRGAIQKPFNLDKLGQLISRLARS